MPRRSPRKAAVPPAAVESAPARARAAAVMPVVPTDPAPATATATAANGGDDGDDVDPRLPPADVDVDADIEDVDGGGRPVASPRGTAAGKKRDKVRDGPDGAAPKRKQRGGRKRDADSGGGDQLVRAVRTAVLDVLASQIESTERFEEDGGGRGGRRGRSRRGSKKRGANAGGL